MQEQAELEYQEKVQSRFSNLTDEERRNETDEEQHSCRCQAQQWRTSTEDIVVAFMFVA